MAYVCESLQLIDNVQTCVSWVVYHQSFFDEINSLSRDDANYIVRNVVSFWLICSFYRMLLKFIER